MKRSKKLFINTVLIAILLFLIYYFRGYYFSKEECILDTIRGLYGTETEMIMELKNNNETLTLMANEDEKTYSLIGTKKIGFLYRIADSYTGYKIKEEEAIDISGRYSIESGTTIIVYRNDKSISKVEGIFESGDIITLDDWHSDFAGIIIDSNDLHHGTYKAYNAAGELIDELFY